MPKLLNESDGIHGNSTVMPVFFISLIIFHKGIFRIWILLPQINNGSTGTAVVSGRTKAIPSVYFLQNRSPKGNPKAVHNQYLIRLLV